MNEAPISAPEEQKENKMRRMVWLLAILAVVSVIAGACAQTSVVQNPNPPESEELRVGDVSEVTLLGMPVKYEILEKVYFRDTKTELGSWSEWTGEECIVSMTADYATNHLDARTVAVFIANCANSGPLGLKYGTREESKEFADNWADLYQASCGDYLGPLGWFAKVESEKKECTLPAFEEAFLD